MNALEDLNHHSNNQKAAEISEDELEHLVRSNDLVVVDCWASWCKHSKRMEPIIDQLAREMAGHVVFVKVNARLNAHLPVRFGIRATPTFIIIKKGDVAEKLVGEQTKEELQRALDIYL